MALLEILHYPDKRLRTKAAPVETVDARIRRIAADMLETMYASQGIGLAATQVNIHQRIIVLDISDSRDQPMCLINPEIRRSSGHEKMEEGCLSVPGFQETVERAREVEVAALNENGEAFTITADAILAVCIQHEIDHLDGKLFVDYLSPLKRRRIRDKLEKQQRRRAVA